MSERENFLMRWSRRKRDQEAEAKRAEAVPPADATSPAKEAATEPDAERPAESADVPTRFDPAARLPSIDSIDAHTDIRDFLRPGVPEELRKAALRRAWSVDPAIRNFKGLQENDWDFNDPNGIPGFGPLDPGLNVRKMALALLRGASDESQTATAKQTAAVEAAEENALLESAKIADEESQAGGDTALQKDYEAKVVPPTHRKRGHGGALPE